MHAWQLSDFSPATLFARHESVESHELIKRVAQPASLTISQEYGPVKVKGWDKEYISIRTVQKGSKEQLENTNVMLDKSKLPHELTCTVSAKDAQKNIAEVSITAEVPFTCNVTINSTQGPIKTKRLLTQSISSSDGRIEIHVDKFTVDSAIFVHNKRGSITLVAPKKIQAHLTASTFRGSVFSELFVTLEPFTTLLNRDYWQLVKKEVHGTLGDGGAPITLEAENGDIKIVAKK